MSISHSPLFKAYIAFALVSFFWGTTYLAIRIGVHSMPPFWMAGIRQLVAGLIMVGYCVAKGQTLPKWNQFGRLIIPGILMIAIGNGLVTWSEQYVNSGLTAILCAMNPVWVVVLSVALIRKEPIAKNVILGILLGFVGVLVIFMKDLITISDVRYVSGVIGIIIANLGWAAGTLYVSKYRSYVSAIQSAGWQMLIAGAIMVAISFMFESPLTTKYTVQGLVALIYLIVFGSIVAFGAFLYMLKELPAAQSSAYSYINTVVAVALGWLLLGEGITANMVIGVCIAICGVYLVNQKGKRQLAVVVQPIEQEE